MATKLRNLKVKKVDFVDQGANPDAYIKLYKRKDGATEVQPGAAESEEKGVWKRFFSAIAKMAGMKPEEINSAVEHIEKGGSETFAEKMNQRKNQRLLMKCGIFHPFFPSVPLHGDEELIAQASSAMLESLEDFWHKYEGIYQPVVLRKVCRHSKKCRGSHGRRVGDYEVCS